MSRDELVDAFGVIGFILMATGLALFSVPLALSVTGGLLILLAIVSEILGSKKPTKR